MGADTDPRDLFCELEYAQLLGALVLFTGDRQDAADVAQEAFARAYWHWGRLRNPRAWVYRVAFNLARAAGRRRLIQRRLEAQSASIDLPDDRHWADALAIRDALQDLPKRQRLALVLRYYADLPVREVATLMRCREGTVRALTHQAIGHLRHTLNEIPEEVDDARRGA